jgi:polyhydroxyalkanoate synthesis regulator phasin
MADPANEFIRDYQTLAQQSWDAWTRQLQQPQAPTHPFFAAPAAPSGNDTLERTLSGLKGYFDWMQGAAGGASQPSTDWRQQLQQMFGAPQPFAQAFGGIDSVGAEGFMRQWQTWMQAAQQGGPGSIAGQGVTPAFGLNREQQMQQQAMSAAMLASMQASGRYQGLIQKANAQAVERMQQKLAAHAEPGRQIDSLKALYDMWVDCAEEAYAAIALSEEFREAYGEMVNAQMRVRQMQQQQTEQLCRELGVPTRTEVASLGERLQALRREVRASRSAATDDDDVMALRRELAALKRQLADTPSARKPTKKVATKQPRTALKEPQRKGAAAKAKASAPPAKRLPKTAAKSTSRTGARKRK